MMNDMKIKINPLTLEKLRATFEHLSNSLDVHKIIAASRPIFGTKSYIIGCDPAEDEDYTITTIIATEFDKMFAELHSIADDNDEKEFVCAPTLHRILE